MRNRRSSAGRRTGAGDLPPHGAQSGCLRIAAASTRHLLKTLR